MLIFKFLISSFIVGGLDGGKCLHEVMNFMQGCMGDNFLSLLLVLGGLDLAVHFEKLIKQVDGVPLVWHMAHRFPENPQPLKLLWH